MRSTGIPVAILALVLGSCGGVTSNAHAQDYKQIFFSEAPSDGGIYVRGNTYFYNGYVPGKGNVWIKGGIVRLINANVAEASNANGTKSYYCRSSIASRTGYCTANGWNKLP